MSNSLLAGSDDDDPPFALAEPPHWAARGLTYLLVGLVLLLGASSVAVTIPETVSGHFVVVPVRGLDPLRSPRKGIARAVRGVEGQHVGRGETLFVIRSEPAGDRFADLRTLQEQLQSTETRETDTRRQYENQLLADREEERTLRDRLASLERTIAIKQRQYDLSASLAANYRQALATRAISTMEYSRPQLDADQLAADLEQAQEQREETRAAIDKLHHEMEVHRIAALDQRRTLESQAEDARIRIAPLTEQLGASANGSSFAIEAPCAGTVVRLLVRAPAAVVGEGDSLGELACTGDRLRAELTLPQSGVSLVQSGQEVKLRYDAFPYQRFGVRYGVVRWVGPQRVVPGDSGGFRALIDLDTTSMLVSGRPQPLLPGMVGRADIIVGRRTLVSYAFEPIRQLRENMATGRAR